MSFMDRNITAAELDKLPTLCQGQAADLKFDDGTYRYWLHRTGIADGEPWENTISVEKLEKGRWIDIDSYDGGPIAS